jgi:hypothetical protein
MNTHTLMLQVDDPTPLAVAEDALDAAAEAARAGATRRTIAGSLVQNYYEEMQEVHQLVPLAALREGAEVCNCSARMQPLSV